MDNRRNIYQNNTVFLSIDDGRTWSEFTDAYACFKTFDRDNYATRWIYIHGVKQGKLGITNHYDIFTNDPHRNDFYFWVDWDDGKSIV